MKLAEEVGIRPKYLTLTEAGKEKIRELGKRPQTIHGGIDHFCRIKQLEIEYAKRYLTDTDKWFGEVRPDIWCESDSEKGVVEVIFTNHVKRDMEKIGQLGNRVNWIHIYFQDLNTKNHYENTFQAELPEQTFRRITFRQLPC